MTDIHDFQDRGDTARRAAGIDGTAGDAQDVPHAFVLDEPTGGCLLCGLSRAYRKHETAPAAVQPPAVDQTERHGRYAEAVHNAMEPDLSLVDQEPGVQALFACAAEAAVALADAEQAEARRKLTTSERIRENADFHLGQEMARRQLAEKEVARLLARVAELEQPAAAAPAVDRAAVLREAAQHLYTALFPAVYDDMGQKAAEGVNRAVSELRRMADEAQQPKPQAHPPIVTWKIETPLRGEWRHTGATYDDHAWATERYQDAIETDPDRPFRLLRATTAHTVEAEHDPEATQ